MRMSSRSFLVLSDITAVRVVRESQALGGPLTRLHAEISRAESGLILQVFGDEKWEADKDVLYAWLVDGRLPHRWRSLKRTIGIHTTASVGRRIANVMEYTRNSDRTRSKLLGSFRLAPLPLSIQLRFFAFGFIL